MHMTKSDPAETACLGNPVKGPLTGITVLDLSRVLAAPWAAQLMADMGAEVIKVERPGLGDDARRLGPFTTLPDGSRGESSFYISANRGKRSITIDMSKPEGQELVRKLAMQSDVLIENFKAGDLKRYGLDYDSIKAINPGIVYCSVTGFGQEGPYSPRPGYDAIFQAMSGLMSVTGPADGEPGAGPTKVGVSMSDMLAGLFSTAAVNAALVQKERSGEGSYIDVALLDSSIAALSHLCQWYLSLGTVPPRRGTEGNGGMPAKLFACGDGKDIMITAGNDAQWVRLCAVMDLNHLVDDPLFKSVFDRSENRKALTPILQEVFLTKPQAYWLEALDKAGVPAGPLYHLDEVFEDEQVKLREMTVEAVHPQNPRMRMVASPVKFGGMAKAVPLHPPLLGEHTDLILASTLGLTESDIAGLRERGII